MRVLRSVGMHVLVFVSLVVVIVFGVRVAVLVRVPCPVGVGVLVGVVGRLHSAYVHRLCRALPRNNRHRPRNSTRSVAWPRSIVVGGSARARPGRRCSNDHHCKRFRRRQRKRNRMPRQVLRQVLAPNFAEAVVAVAH